jgi:hypothetical protein
MQGCIKIACEELFFDALVYKKTAKSNKKLTLFTLDNRGDKRSI